MTGALQVSILLILPPPQQCSRWRLFTSDPSPLSPSLQPSCLRRYQWCSKTGRPFIFQKLCTPPFTRTQTLTHTHTSTIAPLKIHKHLFSLGEGDWVGGLTEERARERGAASLHHWPWRCLKDDELSERMVDGDILLWNNLKGRAMMEG